MISKETPRWRTGQPSQGVPCGFQYGKIEKICDACYSNSSGKTCKQCVYGKFDVVGAETKEENKYLTVGKGVVLVLIVSKDNSHDRIC